eukprot:PhM_4_TR3370/c1_g1_i1/m.20671
MESYPYRQHRRLQITTGTRGRARALSVAPTRSMRRQTRPSCFGSSLRATPTSSISRRARPPSLCVPTCSSPLERRARKQSLLGKLNETKQQQQQQNTLPSTMTHDNHRHNNYQQHLLLLEAERERFQSLCQKYDALSLHTTGVERDRAALKDKIGLLQAEAEQQNITIGTLRSKLMALMASSSSSHSLSLFEGNNNKNNNNSVIITSEEFRLVEVRHAEATQRLHHRVDELEADRTSLQRQVNSLQSELDRVAFYSDTRAHLVQCVVQLHDAMTSAMSNLRHWAGLPATSSSSSSSSLLAASAMPTRKEVREFHNSYKQVFAKMMDVIQTCLTSEERRWCGMLAAH